MHLRLVCLLLVASLPACTTWRVSIFSPKDVISFYHPDVVRITRPSGYYIVIKEPITTGDSLVGRYRGQPYAMAFSDISEVAIRDVSKSKTIAMGVGVSAIVFWTVIVPEFLTPGPDDLSAHVVATD